LDDAFNQALLDLSENDRRAVRAPQYDQPPQQLRRALAAISTTDLMTAGISSAPVGFCLNPAVPEARAAWYSYGFFIRRAAAVSEAAGQSPPQRQKAASRQALRDNITLRRTCG
jgi:hypothetical protein